MALYWSKIVDPSRSPCLRTVQRKSFEPGNFLVLRPVLLKIAYFNQVIDSFPVPYCPKSCGKEKLSIPLEAHHKAQSSENFLSFQPKNWKSCNFLSFGQSCWNCIFKRRRWIAFKRPTACRIPAKRSCSSHLLGWSQAGQLRRTLDRNYGKL